jgi:hypothetical protein
MELPKGVKPNPIGIGEALTNKRRLKIPAPPPPACRAEPAGTLDHRHAVWRTSRKRFWGAASMIP